MGSKKKISRIKHVDNKMVRKSNLKMPRLSEDLLKRIQLVRRDIGNLLFHFTRAPEKDFIVKTFDGEKKYSKSALSVLNKILAEGELKGTSAWIKDSSKCVCFTEAPISELSALFALVNIAASEDQRPRYEPYGIAVSKEWLFEKGGRPVIYDRKDLYYALPKEMKCRYVDYNPNKNIDYTWEREWRIKTEELKLDPKNTLVIVPDSSTAFEVAHMHRAFGRITDDDPFAIDGLSDEFIHEELYFEPKWLVTSLDLFGINLK
jgi:hypothetical protein